MADRPEGRETACASDAAVARACVQLYSKRCTHASRPSCRSATPENRRKNNNKTRRAAASLAILRWTKGKERKGKEKTLFKVGHFKTRNISVKTLFTDRMKNNDAIYNDMKSIYK